MLRRTALAASFLALSGCASYRPPAPSTLEQCALAASFRAEGVLTSSKDDATRAVLVPVDAKGKLDLDHPVFSAFARGGQVYFLELTPGRYGPAAFSWVSHGLRHSFRFSAEETAEAAIELAPGQTRSLGDFVVKRRFPGWGKWLLGGAKSLRVLFPPWRPAQVSIDASLKIHDRTIPAEGRALRQAVRDLAGTEWASAASRRLLEIKPPRDATVEGLLWGRTSLPLKAAEGFSWVDTLQWGSPSPVEGGLEWRHPKRTARIQVRLVKEGSPGFRPLESLLSELKGRGSPEDSHASFEVAVSSRAGQAVRYTSYHYPEPYLTGTVTQVSVTETALVPDKAGYWVVQVRASQKDFERVVADFVKFRRFLRLEPPPKKEER